MTQLASEVRYGDDRRAWHPSFIEYMSMIVDHPNYAGMPCTRDDEGKIDWTIPSNRSRGSKNWDGNVRRRGWWEAKAVELGIARTGHWLSRTAKANHPTGRKPCQTCGRVMELGYVYPTAATVRQLNAHLPSRAALRHEDYLSVDEVVGHLFWSIGSDAARAAFRLVFPEARATSGGRGELAAAIRQAYCDRESRKFSPGAMANPPDRLDGFHTYNLCCRSRQDTGRSRENLLTYTVDRRAYEQWCEGDWAVADLVMAKARVGTCANPACRAEGPISADHVGPISLGFAHTPYFQPLCTRCNSAKGNRMSHADVQYLLRLEAQGITVVSWQARPLWDACKRQVRSDHDALLLSKLLRINQHHFLAALTEAVELGVPDVLLQFLQPQRALWRVELMGFNPSTLQFRFVEREKRQDTYARMRAARMCRIAYEALREYAAKVRRNVQLVDEALLRPQLDVYRGQLTAAVGVTSAEREALLRLLENGEDAATKDDALAAVLDFGNLPQWPGVRQELERVTGAVAAVLTERFARGEAVSWDDATFAT